ncbi:T9SS type A sorting domain-containing protein [candidate division KSB1 bacterium]|nr:T9SS type A sorting domain-containing protein [candidate division KSB1 bacterium]
MKGIVTFSFALLALAETAFCQPPLRWDHVLMYEDTQGGGDSPRAICDDGNGVCALAMLLPWSDTRLVKLDAEGNVGLSYDLGFEHRNSVVSIARMSNGDFLISGDRVYDPNWSDTFIARADSVGNLLWITEITGGAEEHCAFAGETPTGYLMAGNTNGYGAGLNDWWILWFDEYGDSLSYRTYGTAGDDVLQAVVPTDDGFLLAGSIWTDVEARSEPWLIKINFDGDSVWSSVHAEEPGNSVLAAANAPGGGFALIETVHYGLHVDSLRFVRTDEFGNATGGRITSNGSWARKLKPCPDAGYTFLTGSSLVRVDDNGNLLWSTRYPMVYHTDYVRMEDNSYVTCGIHSYDFPWGQFIRSEVIRTFPEPVLADEHRLNPQPDFALTGAYPNPFNSSTRLRYRLAELGPVALDIFDITGRMVTTLMDGVQPAGDHTITFDGSRLASGLYLCRLSSREASVVEKIVLLK